MALEQVNRLRKMVTVMTDERFSAEDISLILKCLKFAATRHKDQRRKGADSSPYINHPIDVASRIWNTGKLYDINVVCAALLHDTVEDTEATFEELEKEFGKTICDLVREVTDDKSLPKARRKELQIEHAREISFEAKHIKIADKTSNIEDIRLSPPPDWSHERLQEYLAWSKKVIEQVRGVNKSMEEEYDKVLTKTHKSLEERS